MPADSDAWRVTTDRATIREWADERSAVPVHEETAGGERRVDVATRGALDTTDEEATEETAGSTDDAAPETDVDADRISWDQFFDAFQAQNLAFRYRPDDDSGTDCELVERDAATGPAADQPGRGDVASDRIVTSDTGEDEPVVDDRVESATQPETAPGNRRDDREDGPGNLSPKRTGETDDPASPMATSARDAETPPIVLEEIYEDPGGFDADPSEEYVVLRNDGEERVELTGWTVENGLDRSYEFPDGFALAPGEEVTIRSGTGEDSPTELHWGSEQPVWRQQGGTVIVRSTAGSRVVREPYQSG